MKKILSILLVFLLMASASVTALAMEGTDDGEGFYIGELPAFGEEDVITFPDEATDEPDPTSAPTTPDGPAIADNATNEDPADASSAQAEPAEDSLTKEGESVEGASPAPEADPIPSEHNNYHVMIIAAVLAIGVIAAMLIKKRKRNTAMDD